LLPFALTFCPHKCVCDDELLETICYETNLEIMPMTLNPSIKTLIMRHNNFHSVDASFNFYPSLELVDLSSNHLVSIPDRAFSSQRRLVELRINSNKISQLGERTFSGLAKLQVLNLEENFIEQLRNKAFKHLKSLKELNLRNNRISDIQSRAFLSLSEVTILDLSDNLLEIIPTDALMHLPNLAELSIANNNIKTIVDQTFSNLFKLSNLDLSGNQIERIHEKAFSQVSSVRQLNLQDNELYEVPSLAFESFQKLENLKIGKNKFSVIEGSAFLHLERLTTLDISGCSMLKSVKANAFGTLSDLEFVKISSNRKLDFIHPEAFGPLPSLNHLDLSNNALESISPTLVPWMNLFSVDLSGNPWHCDCQNSFLKNVIVNTVNNSDSIPIVRCWNPPPLRDTDIAFLDIDCEMVQSPKTDQSVSTIDNTAIMAVICSSGIVVIVVLMLILISFRKSVKSCIYSTISKPDNIPVSSSKILQYQPYQEPRYVSHYSGAQTLKPVLTVNPYQQTLIRHDQYFATLASQQRGIYQAHDSDKKYFVQTPEDLIYMNSSCEERIYHGEDQIYAI